ncbi:hypothetical protein [Paenibacillus prosopidis]|uniref:hypothetical protein n=1 Tax=Paenibacillus prosopidis TaxID=630520 RepID=UPI0011C06D79|nr:hypothetical protein [Paenibacillus prosopidis]
MHAPSIVINNWEKIKHKRVIWRSIGQSFASVEQVLQPYRNQGLEIVWYSPIERMIPGYIGEDAVIRFYKDPAEYHGWVGNKNQIMALNQSMRERAIDCNAITICFIKHAADFQLNYLAEGTRVYPRAQGNWTMNN